MTLLVCFFISHTRLRVQSKHPAFPAPSVGASCLAKPGQLMPRECEGVSCLLFDIFESEKARRPGQAKRDPGPITTGPCALGRSGHSFPDVEVLWLWVPAFAGTTLRCGARAMPLAVRPHRCYIGSREAASRVRSHISPGPYRSFRELSLAGSVDPDIWCPPTFVGNSGIERFNGDCGFALFLLLA